MPAAAQPQQSRAHGKRTVSTPNAPASAGDQASAKGEDLGRTVIGTVELAARGAVERPESLFEKLMAASAIPQASAPERQSRIRPGRCRHPCPRDRRRHSHRNRSARDERHRPRRPSLPPSGSPGRPTSSSRAPMQSARSRARMRCPGQPFIVRLTWRDRTASASPSGSQSFSSPVPTCRRGEAAARQEHRALGSPLTAVALGRRRGRRLIADRQPAARSRRAACAPADRGPPTGRPSSAPRRSGRRPG